MEKLLEISSRVTTVMLLAGVLLWVQAPDGRTADAVLKTGLVILIATPVTRLLAALVEEVRAREWRYVALGFAVLVLLGGSIAVAMYLRPS